MEEFNNILKWTGIVLLYLSAVATEEVCYDEIGCFSNDAPYDTLPSFPPQSPSVVNVRFLLYTRLNKDLWMEISRKDPKSLEYSLFNSELKTFFYIHGWNNVGYRSSFVQRMKDALLEVENCNVFLVDWTGGSGGGYMQAIQNARVAGREVGYFLQFLNDETLIEYERMHLMGDSLGAQTAGFAGETQPGIGRISGFDPAGPFFRNQDPVVRLDETDALYVDVIHTDGESALRLGLGMLQPMGHADFYPNGGKEQPGCPKNATDYIDDRFSRFGCSHARAPTLFLDSLNPAYDCEFISYPCRNWEDFTSGLCTDCGPLGCPVLGYYADQSRARGIFFLETGSTSPFCQI